MSWGNNPMGDFGPKIPEGSVVGAIPHAVLDRPVDNVVPIREEPAPQFAEAIPREAVLASPAQPTMAQAELVQQPQPEGPSIQGLAMHLAPLLVAGIAGAAGGALASKNMTGALIGGAATVAVVGLARALAGGMYGIPTQLRAMDGAASVAGAVAAGYLAFFADPPKTKKRKPAKKKRKLFLQREDDFDEDGAEELEES